MDVAALELTLKVDETLEFELKDLAQGTPGITCAFGKCLAEAAGVCLEEQAHLSPKTMKISGEAEGEAQLKWENTTDQMRRCWNDDEVATEHGAYGIATLLVPQISKLEVVERSKKGTGFDYWLGSGTEDEPLFQKKARLEVSGIRSGDEATIARRIRQKLEQSRKSEGRLSAVVIVVEFGKPESRVAKR